jgi:hypothetical protein
VVKVVGVEVGVVGVVISGVDRRLTDASECFFNVLHEWGEEVTK